MADEELIYRITRAVYGRLGAGADESVVEQLVTDVYRAIEPVVANGGGGRAAAEGVATNEREREAREAGSAERLIVSVFGVDHPGIVAGVSEVLAEAGCSIIDINQTVVRSKFAMIIIADMSRAKETASALKERFRAEGSRLGVRIYAQREDLFNAMHRI
ncbi:MAG TPA: ACT domain-containing protein [Pyrinomonadaceae bacterium]|nr:ACT domain-containing protein [Pyrinomonadaceae bacterium]